MSVCVLIEAVEAEGVGGGGMVAEAFGDVQVPGVLSVSALAPSRGDACFPLLPGWLSRLRSRMAQAGKQGTWRGRSDHPKGSLLSSGKGVCPVCGRARSGAQSYLGARSVADAPAT